MSTTNKNQAVRSLLLPLGDSFLLLPSTLIAEVIPYREPENLVDNAPDWLQGRLHWRGQDLPLLSLEVILGIGEAEDEDELPDYRIIILYGLKDIEKLPFYAFVSDGMPRTLNITPDSLGQPETLPQAGLLAEVAVIEQSAYLPDLDYIQDLILDCGAL